MTVAIYALSAAYGMTLTLFGFGIDTYQYWVLMSMYFLNSYFYYESGNK